MAATAVKSIFIVAILSCFAASPVCGAGDTTPPNIVLILADDLGWRDTGFMGSDFYETPNLDQLADGGMMFTDAYANGSNCAPSRAALMSGRYGPRTGVYSVGSSNRGKAANRRLLAPANRRKLSPDVVTLAEVLQSRGYTTASIGKWHLGDGPETGPLGQGFDHNVGGNQSGHPKSYFSPYRNKNLPDGAPGEYLTTRLTDEAIAFLQEQREEPFFLYLPYYTVHTPLQPESSRLEYYQSKPPGQRHRNPKYAAMVEALDANIGRLLTALDEQGLDQDTLIVFASDNGGSAPSTTMAPLRGSKGMFSEGGIRVPLVVRWPGHVAPGVRCSTPVMLMDLYPTLVEAAGGTADTSDGESLLGLLTDGCAPLQRALFWHFPAYLEAAPGRGIGPWRATPCSVIREENYKLLEFFEDGRLELYDLSEDIGETRNLAMEMPARTRQLHEKLVAWRAQVEAPVPKRRPNIILFLADDLGYGELGCYGQDKIATPNIDRLAQQGLRFTQFYSGSPVCAPSRCTIMTGLHTGHAYIRNNKGRAVVGQHPILQDTVTVARLLQSGGYTTGCVGKWGLGGPDTTGVPWLQGFDLFFGYLDQWRAHNHHPTYLYRNEAQVPLDNPDFAAHQKLKEAPKDPAEFEQYRGDDYAPDRMIDEAMSFVREHRDDPFFLFYATTVPHVAIQVPQDSLEDYPEEWDDEPYLGQKGYVPHPRPRAGYAAMITRMDDHFGRLMALVEELGLDQDTLVLFTSDNGPTYAGGVDYDFFQSSGPLRGLKGSVFEGGIRVPLIARWANHVPEDATTDQVATAWDLMPTLLDIAGVKVPRGLDGMSLAPVLLGRAKTTDRADALYWELGNQQAVRYGPWKLVRRTNKKGETTVMLFNLDDDIGETHDLAEERPEVLAAMLGRARAERTPSEVFTSVYDDGR
jgi:arylsulfatase